MKFGYKTKNGKELISDKFSDFKKFKCALEIQGKCNGKPFLSSYNTYETYEAKKPATIEFIKEVSEAFLDLLDCDVVEPIFHYQDMGEYFDDKYGFFLVKDDVITEFVTFDFADGFLKAVKAIKRS